MNLKNSKGITLISLTVAVIIMFVIGGAILFNVQSQMHVKKVNNLYIDIDAISSRIDDYYLNYGELPTICRFMGKQEFMNMLVKIGNDKGARLSYDVYVNPNDSDDYYVIDLEKLEGLTLNYGYDTDYIRVKTNKAITITDVEDEIYVINEKTHQIYFPHGIFVDNEMYYTYDMDTNITEFSKPNYRDGLKVGDYVDYTYDSSINTYSLAGTASGYTGGSNGSSYNETTTSKTYSNQILNRPTTALKWRILSINDDGSVDLISTTQGSQSTIAFQGSRGYNNEIFILNDIAQSFYTNSSLGKKATARSVNIDDIENHFTEAGITARNNFSYYEDGTKYGKIQTYSSNKFYPKLYEREKLSGTASINVKKSGVDRSDRLYTTPMEINYGESTGIDGLTSTQTYYNIALSQNNVQNKVYDEQNNETIGQSETSAKDLILSPTGTNWVASRFANCDTNYIRFGIFLVDGSNIRGNGIFWSNGTSPTYAHYLRPVIHLDSSVNINIKAGTEEEMHEIVPVNL